MKMKRNVEGLRRNAQKKHEETLQKLEAGIRKLNKEKRPINFNTVAQAANISKAWLYKEPKARLRIEHLRSQVVPRQETPRQHQASDPSLKALVKSLKARVKELDERNRELSQQNQVAYGFMARAEELERQLARLKAENQSLRQKPQPSAVLSFPGNQLAEIEALGVEVNSTLQRLMAETPASIVSTAVESLQEALATRSVRNPGGFLYTAITEAWKPNEKAGEDDTGNRSVLKEWFNLACEKRLVIGARHYEGIQYVITPDDKHIPFEDMLEQYPIAKLTER